MRARRINRGALAAVAAFGVVVTVAPSSSQAAGAAVADPGDPSGPFFASIPAEGEGSFVGMADDPVATAASNNPYLTTLTSAVQAAGLVETLNGRGPFTIFAPSNEAFATVPQSDLDAILTNADLLTNILTYHVVAGQSLTRPNWPRRARRSPFRVASSGSPPMKMAHWSSTVVRRWRRARTSPPPTPPCT